MRHAAGRLMVGAAGRLVPPVVHQAANMYQAWWSHSVNSGSVNLVPASGSVTLTAGGGFATAQGDVIVVKISTWESTVTWGTPVGGGLTFASQVASAASTTTASSAIYAATVGSSPVATTVSVTFSNSGTTAGYAGITVERWNIGVLAATPNVAQTANVAATPFAVNCNAVGTNSAITWVASDYNGTAMGTPTYATGNVGSSNTEDAIQNYANNFSILTAWTRPAAAGAVTVGTTAPTGQKTAICALEIQGT